MIDVFFIRCLSKKEIVESGTWKSLRVLRLSHNMISKLDSSLSLLPSVEFIDLSHNKIKAVSHFQDCYNLRRLDLSFNQIEDLSDIAKCVGNISELLLRHNQIQSADGLNRLPALEKLDLSYNQIGSTTAIEMLRDIAFLKELWLEMNPFAYKNGYRLFIQRIFKECPNCFDIMLDSKPLFGSTDSAEFDTKGTFASDSFNSIQALQKRAQLSKEKYKVKPKLIQITPNDKKKHDVISSSPSQVADSAKNLVQHAEALKHDVGKKWLSVLTEEKSQKSDSKDDDSEDIENSFYHPKLDEAKEHEVKIHEETIPISRFSNSSNHSKKSTSNSEHVLSHAPSEISEEKKLYDVIEEEILMISPLSSPLNPEDVKHVCDQDQWTVFVSDHRRVLCISKGVVIEKDLSRGSILSEYRLSEIGNYIVEKNVLKINFHKGKSLEYFVPDVQELSEICKIIEEHQISKIDTSNSKDIDKRVSNLEEEESASILMDPSTNLIVMSDYFHSDSKNSVRVKSSQDNGAFESHVISQFISQYRSKRLTFDFSENFQVGVLEHKRHRSEQSAVFLFHEKRIYLFDKSQIETNDPVVTVIVNKSVASISKIIIGFFMRYMRLDFNDNSSLLLITGDKEKSTHLVQLLLSSAKASDALISLQNRDRETLDAFQAQVLKGASEDIKLYELLFDGEGKESGSGKLGSTRTLILTDKRAFLCWEDHQKWAKDSFNSLFTVISSEMRTKFLGSDTKEYRSSYQFSLIFGSEKQFAVADSKRKWILYTRDGAAMNRILDELARKV